LSPDTSLIAFPAAAPIVRFVRTGVADEAAPFAEVRGVDAGAFFAGSRRYAAFFFAAAFLPLRPTGSTAA
jgi:hypothetical protein